MKVKNQSGFYFYLLYITQQPFFKNSWVKGEGEMPLQEAGFDIRMSWLRGSRNGAPSPHPARRRRGGDREDSEVYIVTLLLP